MIDDLLSPVRDKRDLARKATKGGGQGNTGRRGKEVEIEGDYVR